ncbi:MAG: hypothetical protein V8S24_03510 [Gordonibacter pamelaeae]
MAPKLVVVSARVALRERGGRLRAAAGDHAGYRLLHDLPGRSRTCCSSGASAWSRASPPPATAAAMARVASYYLPAGVVREQLGGVDFYRFLKDLLAHYDERAGRAWPPSLRSWRAPVRGRRLTGELHGFRRRLRAVLEAGGALGRFEDRAPTTPEDVRLAVPAPLPRNEAFVVPTDVCYAAHGLRPPRFRARPTRAPGRWPRARCPTTSCGTRCA